MNLIYPRAGKLPRFSFSDCASETKRKVKWIYFCLQFLQTVAQLSDKQKNKWQPKRKRHDGRIAAGRRVYSALKWKGTHLWKNVLLLALEPNSASAHNKTQVKSTWRPSSALSCCSDFTDLHQHSGLLAHSANTEWVLCFKHSSVCFEWSMLHDHSS